MLFFLTLLLISGSNAASQSWERRDFRLPDNHLLGSSSEIFFSSPDTGWLHSRGYLKSGDYVGDVMISTDAGDSWQLRLEGVEAFFAMDASFLWASRRDSLFFSTNSGATWDTIPFPVFVQQLHFADRTHGIALTPVGEECRRTSDGGRHWQLADTLVRLTYRQGISFPVPEIGWMVSDESPFASDNGMIARTSDAGKSWTYQELLPDHQVPILYSVLFLDTLRGFAAGPGHLLSTQDGGKIWSYIFLPVSGRTLARSERGVLYASGWNGAILYSIDTGTTWLSMSTGASATITYLAAEGTGGRIMAFARLSETEGLLLRVDEEKVLSVVSFPDGHLPLGLEIHTYPAPFSEILTVEFSASIGEHAVAFVYDLAGKLIHRDDLGIVAQERSIWHWRPRTGKLAKGPYLLVIQAGSTGDIAVLQYTK